MKNIVLLSSDINIEYCITILQGVVKFFEQKKDVHLIVTQVKSNSDLKGTYVYQYGSVQRMIEADDIDGYIVLSTTFGDFLYEMLQSIRNKNNKPIVSIGVELPFSNCYSTVCNTKKIYKEIVSHLIKEHNCRKIGFFSAKDANSDEANERYNSYLEALKVNSLEFNPDYILDGNFTRYQARKIILEKYKSKEDVPFDAIICANDLTASGCVEAFTSIGLSIPDDVKIIGFDDSPQASLSEPSISTVNQQMSVQGETAAELIYKKLTDHDIPHRTEVDLSPIYRQTCGCIELNNKDYVYKNKYGEIVRQETNFKEYIRNYYERVSDSRNIYVIFDFIHSNDTMKDFINNVDKLLSYSKFLGMAICLYKKPVSWEAGDEFNMPSSATIANLIERSNGLFINSSETTFNPNSSLIPKEYDDVPGFFILNPIYNGALNYGYFFCHFTEPKLEIYTIYIKIINQAIAQAAEYSRTIEKNIRLEEEKKDLQTKNTNLSQQSKTDELTKVLNRRGFMDYGQQIVNLSTSMGTTGVVFFADLDKLKTINDKFGHKMGDMAIQLCAQALKQSFRKGDLVARLSGDEFAVVASNMSLELLTRCRRKLAISCRKLSRENDLPFTLSISLGGVEYNSDSNSLKDLLSKADASLYEEKEKHHKRLENKG